jgi:hypothetical protein
MSGKNAPKGESSAERSLRLAREQQRRIEASRFGLDLHSLHAAHAMSNDAADLLLTVAREDGIGVRQPGGEIAKLIAHGFIEIEIEIEHANGHASRAVLSRNGWRALCLRLAKRLP